MRHLLSTAIALSTLTIPVIAQTPHPPEQPAQTETDSPRRLTISVSVADPADLKVKEGDRLQVGDLVADRGRERQRLETQMAQLALTLERLQTATITPPLPPAQLPDLAALPSTSYLEQETAVESARRAWELKQEELGYLQAIAGLDPLILEHEQANLKELEQAYWLEQGRLQAAQQQQAYREYEHTLAIAQRIDAENQAMLAYQRQWAEYEERLRSRDYQVSQTQLKLDEVNNAIASLSVVRAPYDGTVRRVQWLGQGADGQLSAEITVMVSGAGSGDGE